MYLLNFHTEEQAKKKWCPNARVSSTRGSYNRSYLEDHIDDSVAYKATRCLASSCMFWKWQDQFQNTGYCGLTHTQGNQINGT